MKTNNKRIGFPGLFKQLLMVFWPPILVFSFHVFLVSVVHIYDSYPRLDVPMHYLGGLSMALSLSIGVSVLQARHTISSLDKIIELILIFTLVATIAVFWEFAEFLLDRFLGTDLQISLPNTMQDLLMGILGAGTLVGYKILKPSQRELAASND